jgi:uncharacterized membrane protein YkgB
MYKNINLKQLSVLLSRFSLFVIYFWFGLLKVIGQSPASPLVEKLFNSTFLVKIVPFSNFLVIFGLFEMLIGVCCIIPKLEKPVFIMFAFHMITTVMPLFMLSGLWTNTLVPTLEGQYIIKNLALIACALCIAASLQNPRNESISSASISSSKIEF